MKTFLRKRFLPALMSLAVLAFLSAGALIFQASAAGPQVTTSDDSGAGSLRQALADAQMGDTITFAADVTTITLDSALEVGTTGLTIDGGGAVTLELSDTGYRHIEVDSGLDSFAMIGVTLTGLGSDGDENGGISAVCPITLTNCTISGCYTVDFVGPDADSRYEGCGGALYAGNGATLTGCHFENNMAANWGGAIESGQSDLITATDCVFTGNSGTYGGAIDADGGSVTMTGCTVSGNSTTLWDGGGLWVNNTATLDNCLFSGNTASCNGGAFYAGDAELTNCIVTGNAATDGYGGGISADTANLTNCTVADNTVINSGDSDGDCGGGGLDIGGGTLVNCTIANNTATGGETYGGGIYADSYGSVTLIHCTVSGNAATYGGGIYAVNESGTPGEAIVLLGSVVAGNYNADDGTANEIVFSNYDDVAYQWIDTAPYNGDGTLTDAGTDVFDGSAYYVFGVPQDGLSALMAATTATIGGETCDVGLLADNNGPSVGGTVMQTILPTADGILIDAVPEATFNGWFDTAPTTDQRGFARVVGDGADIGAVEVQVPAAPVIGTQPTDLTLTAGETDKALTVGATVTDGGTLSYQWYSNTTNSTEGGTAIDGATGASFTPPATNEGDMYYYVVVTNTLDGNSVSTTSNVVKVTVEAGPAVTGVAVGFTYLWIALAAGLVLAGTAVARKRATGR